MRRGEIALFLSGLFFGGAVDHAILMFKGSRRTPYGVEAGVLGNGLFGLLDLAVAALLLGIARPGGRGRDRRSRRGSAERRRRLRVAQAAGRRLQNP